MSLTKNPLLLTVVVLFLLTCMRLKIGHFDISYFISAGEKFIITEQLNFPIFTKQNDGYDGLFFYRYALNPFSQDIQLTEEYKGNHGIKVDQPKYRRSRVIYPFLAWCLAFGQTQFIPYSLVMINFMAFVLIAFIAVRLVRHFRAPPLFACFPLLISGLYLSLARDLSDTLTCALLILSYWLYLNKKNLPFLVLSTCCLLCKETSAFILAPAFVLLFIEGIKAKHTSWKIFRVGSIFLPIVLFMIWKVILNQYYPSSSGPTFGESLKAHFTFPLSGMIQSIWLPKEVSKRFLMQFAQIIFFAWHLYLIVLCLKLLIKKGWKLIKHWLPFAVALNIIISLSYSHLIYMDPWSYLRVLAPFHLFCFLFIIESRFRIPSKFILFSCFPFLLTIYLFIYG